MQALIYAGQVSLYAAILWGIFRIVWRNQPYLNLSRGILLLSLLLPAFLPFIRLPRPEAVQRVAFQEALPALRMNMQSADQPLSFDWPDALLWLYCSVALFQLIVFLSNFLRIQQKLKLGRTIVLGDYRLITECRYGPGTLGRTIFFPTAEIDPVILEHERAHIGHGHRFDLWLLLVTRILFWFSPAHWLLASELKAIHEFQADQEARKTTETSEYMNLLVSRALGSAQFLPVAHFFSPQLLKRRIMMLQKTKAAGMKPLLLATILLGAGFLSTVLFAQTRQSTAAIAVSGSESKRIYPDVPTQNLRPNYGEVGIQGAAITFKIVEKRPAFNGNLYEWMQKNLQTKNMGIDEKTPACIVQFVVSETGEIQNPSIQQSSGVPVWDAEVLRVVKSMPVWNPGMQQGKPVAVSVALPVMYNGAGGC